MERRATDCEAMPPIFTVDVRRGVLDGPGRFLRRIPRPSPPLDGCQRHHLHRRDERNLQTSRTCARRPIACPTSERLCQCLSSSASTGYSLVLAAIVGTLVFHYLFTITCSFQGLFIFLLHGIIKKDFQDAWRMLTTKNRVMEMKFSSKQPWNDNPAGVRWINK
ncbi:hypothetical protein OS493_039599 [Desmophyllum pertusum]|uniref:Uncharacterized protein n=1 Tax=Desmophyllum pertusum TaxID=174260 RepID=A0A9W9ZY42_9CNID|nr:hypothetical protein OS493_039599 [Desmophyllum pertusum]